MNKLNDGDFIDTDAFGVNGQKNRKRKSGD